MQQLKSIYIAGAFVFAVVLCGCKSRSQQTALEVESRQQSQWIRQLEDKVQESEKLLAQQDREIEALRSKGHGGIITVSGTGKTQSAPHELVANWGGVSALKIHQLTSGLSPSEADPSIQIVLQPLDEDDELIKVAGKIQLTAALVAADGVPQQVINHSLSITESRKAWTRGLVSSGFHVQMPIDAEVWNAVKHENQKLLVTASLNLGADRVYTATQLFDQTN